MASDRKGIMTADQKLFAWIAERMEAFEPEILSIYVSNTREDEAVSFALVAPQCVDFLYTPGAGVMLDNILN